jgi:hypothetical protein
MKLCTWNNEVLTVAVLNTDEAFADLEGKKSFWFFGDFNGGDCFVRNSLDYYKT